MPCSGNSGWRPNRRLTSRRFFRLKTSSWLRTAHETSSPLILRPVFASQVGQRTNLPPKASNSAVEVKYNSITLKIKHAVHHTHRALRCVTRWLILGTNLTPKKTPWNPKTEGLKIIPDCRFRCKIGHLDQPEFCGILPISVVFLHAALSFARSK